MHKTSKRSRLLELLDSEKYSPKTPLFPLFFAIPLKFEGDFAVRRVYN
jgi:hypothetical protein